MTNVDEAGSLTLSSVQPQVGTALTATLTDPEGVVSTDWVWERSQDKQTWEEIKGASVAGETYTTYTPGAADLDAYLRVSVTYTDGAGASKFVQIVSPHAVRTAPVNNAPPAFTETTVARTVGVNARAGSRVGASVRAEDPEVTRSPTPWTKRTRTRPVSISTGSADSSRSAQGDCRPVQARRRRGTRSP